MKIAYVARCDASHESGVLKKLICQAESWRACGHHVDLLVVSPGRGAWPQAPSNTNIIPEGDPLRRGLQFWKLARRIAQAKPDVVYIRYSTFYSGLAWLMHRIPSILELNTNDIAEYRTYLPASRYWVHRATRSFMMRPAAGFVCVTREISSTVPPSDAPVAVIANGIDLSSVAPIAAPCNVTPRLLFIGAPGAAWHGVDKILRLARLLPRVDFDLVGPHSVPEQPANVVAHGMLGASAYRAIAAQADVAVGTLAMHRNAMQEGCTLKLREYLAMGLPTIIGYRDTDFPEPMPFLLQLANTENNVETAAADILEFVRRWMGKRVEREQIAHLDGAIKEEERLDFMSRVAASSRLRNVS